MTCDSKKCKNEREEFTKKKKKKKLLVKTAIMYGLETMALTKIQKAKVNM